MSPVQEPKIDVLEDVINRGVTLYKGGFPISRNPGFLYTKHHKRFSEKVQQYIKDRNGVYPYPVDQSIPEYILEDVIKNGAAFVNTQTNVEKQSRLKPDTFRFIRVGKENFQICAQQV